MHLSFYALREFFTTPPRTLLAFSQRLTALLPVGLLAGVAVSEALLIVIVTCFLIDSFRRRDASWMCERWVKLALILWVYLVAISPFAEHSLDAFRHSMGWLRYVIFGAALAYWTLNDAHTRRALFTVLLAAVAFLVADLFFQYSTGVDFFGRAILEAGENSRLTGPYSMPRAGIMLSWISFPVIAWALMQPQPRTRVIGILFTAAILVAVVLTGDRMPMLNMLFGLGLTLLFIPVSWRTRILASGGLIAIAGTVIALHPVLLERQFYSVIRTITHVNETPYGMLWQSAWNIFEAHPIFGAGLHHFRHVCPDETYGPLTNLAMRCNLHPHNVYMEWLSETGLVGFSLFVALVITWLMLAIQGIRAQRANPLVVGLSVELMIRLWPLSTTTSVLANWSAVPLMMILGWLLATITNRSSMPSSEKARTAAG